MKGDELGSAVGLAVPSIDVLDGDAPSFRPELVCVLAPRLLVPPGGVSIVPDIRAGRNGDFAAQANVPGCPAVQELRDGREKSKALVDDRGQVRQVVSVGTRQSGIVKRVNLAAQKLLRILQRIVGTSSNQEGRMDCTYLVFSEKVNHRGQMKLWVLMSGKKDANHVVSELLFGPRPRFSRRDHSCRECIHRVILATKPVAIANLLA